MNTNLRLMQVQPALLAMAPRPDWIILCGDVTDNGYGYYLLDRVFREWIDARKLLVVPGNHALNWTQISALGIEFQMEPGTFSREEKETNFWRWFEGATGQQPFSEGVGQPVAMGEGTWFVGLDSVKDNGSGIFPSRRNAVGEIGRSSLRRLREVVGDIRSSACTVLVALHHHVLWKGLARALEFGA